MVALKKAAIKSATISNNHIGDFGGEAALFTQQLLNKNDIEVIGLTEGKKAPYSQQVIIIWFLRSIIIFAQIHKLAKIKHCNNIPC